MINVPDPHMSAKTAAVSSHWNNSVLYLSRMDTHMNTSNVRFELIGASVRRVLPPMDAQHQDTCDLNITAARNLSFAP